jgi:methylmalonyl-CoA mutase
VKAAAAERAKSYKSGDRKIVGTTLYPAKTERPVQMLTAAQRPGPTDGVVFCDPLVPVRIDQEIEA